MFYHRAFNSSLINDGKNMTLKITIDKNP
uniref:Uncharacterized protein n=1 Tax=Anguilla anguilla TaxID=7936 RepID=A0A0E9XLX6_ANGAN